MAVFDFNREEKENTAAALNTYEVFCSNKRVATAEDPILVLSNQEKQWAHHASGMFANPMKANAFDFNEDGVICRADILSVDARFVNLIKWLGENHIVVKLSGENTSKGYCVYHIRETGVAVRGAKLSAEDGFLQFMMEKLFASDAPVERVPDEDVDAEGDDMKLTSIRSITDFLT